MTGAVAPNGWLCLDVGSTWTKAAFVLPEGRLLGTAQHPTTPPEVLTGITRAAHRLGVQGAGLPPLADPPESAVPVGVLACSSAGGGLRLAVVGQERLVSAEAGRRVALSAGARVVHVSTGELDGAGVRALRAARPDVMLLVGGTDGGDTRVLVYNARRLAANRIACPIVLAGNADGRDEALSLLRGTRRTVVVADNVLPDVGELEPGPARAAIRGVFLDHVIGGKGLSRGPRFRRLVRAVTPEAVLVGVGRLAALVVGPDAGGAVLVIDVGGATTDVYSAVSDPPEREEHAVALPADRRTVEGDIGMRWSAPGVVAEAAAERLLDEGEAGPLAEAAARRVENVGFVPGPADAAGAAVDARLAALAAVLAVRRHLRLVDGRFGPRGVGLVVLSGGVFRHATDDTLASVRHTLRSDPMLRPVLRGSVITVDTDYVLAPAGLLVSSGHGAAADALLRARLVAPASAAAGAH